METETFEVLLFFKINKHLWESIDLTESDMAQWSNAVAANLEDELYDGDSNVNEMDHINGKDSEVEEEVQINPCVYVL